MTGEGKVTDQQRQHREFLQDTEQRAQAAFDKTLVSLSGGALGVSFAFVRQFIGDGQVSMPTLLVSAWVCWTASLAAVLSSHFFSALAMRKAIARVDQKEDGEEFGGRLDTMVAVLNAVGGLLFLIGLVVITVFAYNNME